MIQKLKNSKVFITTFLLTLFLFSISSFAGTGEEFSIILIPDTQNYADYKKFKHNLPNTYKKQTEWIRDNRVRENIKFVIHLGDMTQYNRDDEWKIAQNAHQVLDDAQVPYSVGTGNHDYSRSVLPERGSLINKYFPPAKFKWKSWYGAAYEGNSANNYCTFQAGDLKFLVLTLEFTPRKDVVSWANQVIKSKKDHRVIIVTHCYQETGGNYVQKHWSADHYNIEGREGADLYRELVKRHSTIFMVVSGHIRGAAYFTRTGNNENPVYEVLTDFQGEKIRNSTIQFGNGWMRKLTFKPGQNQIKSSVFSVEDGNPAVFEDGITDFNMKGHEKAYKDNDFTAHYDMMSPVKYNYSVLLDDYLFRDRTANKNTAGRQTEPAIASDYAGNFVTVWADDTDGNGSYNIFARGFDKDGNQIFGPMQVHKDDSGNQRNPSIAMDRYGNFIVAWEDNRSGTKNIWARGFTINGVERIAEFPVNTDTRGTQRNPSAGMSYYGDFVIAWEDDYDSNNSYNICARGFRYNGTALFNQFRVNSDRSGQQFHPTVAMGSPDGSFVIAWEDDKNSNGYYNILARGFHKNGTEALKDFRVHSNSAGQQKKPSAAMSYYGDFVIAWEDDYDNNGSYNIYARGFNRKGEESIGDFLVNGNRRGQQKNPAAAYSYKGGFAVAWEDDNDKNGYYSILARFYNQDGTLKGSEVRVNSDSDGRHNTPVITMRNHTYAVSAWEDDMNLDNNYDILVRNLTY